MAYARQVIVTGGESGIGAACAAAFGSCGDRVAVFYHSRADDAKVSAQAIEAVGGEAMIVQCSVDDEASVEAAFAAVEQAWGLPHVLVNSAGINMSGIQVRDMTRLDWSARIDTDLTGAFLVSRRFLNSKMDGEAFRSIIHISSIHAFAVRDCGAGYCAAKGGLKNLVKTLAIEEATRGIRVNAIEPGMILTPMNERALTDIPYRTSLEQNIPMKRAGRPEEVAALAVWLASEAASYVTGASIVVDGGLSLLAAVGA